MLEAIPTAQDLRELLGTQKYQVWTELCAMIDHLYEMERTWNHGGKAWKYEYKYRRGGKTLCALCAKEDCVGLLMIFGKAERERVEPKLSHYSHAVQQVYQDATTYHDGKWVMFEPESTEDFEAFQAMLAVKRKPNKK